MGYMSLMVVWIGITLFTLLIVYSIESAKREILKELKNINKNLGDKK